MLDPYQVVEARVWGADAILIIMASVNDDEARSLADAARDYDMDALFEVHDEAELARALALDAELIGINNRNLKTFETRLETTELLAPLVPRNRLIVGESGIFSNSDMHRLARCGVKTFLVGESLMRQPDVRQATAVLLGREARGQHRGCGCNPRQPPHRYSATSTPRATPTWSTSPARMLPTAPPSPRGLSPWRRQRWHWRPPATARKATCWRSPGSPASWRPNGPTS